MIDGKALRQRAWKISRQRWLPLAGHFFLCCAPALFYGILAYANPWFGKTWIQWPFAVLGQVLSLGLSIIALGYVDGDDDAACSFFSFAENGRLGKALLMGLSMWAVTAVGNLLSYLGVLGSLLGLFLSLMFGTLVSFLFARDPDGPVLGHWKKLFSLIGGYLTKILTYQLWLVALIFALPLGILMLFVGARILHATVCVLLCLCVIFAAVPFLVTAQALLVDTLLKEEKKAKRTREKKQKKPAKQTKAD